MSRAAFLLSQYCCCRQDRLGGGLVVVIMMKELDQGKKVDLVAQYRSKTMKSKEEKRVKGIATSIIIYLYYTNTNPSTRVIIIL